MNSSLPQSQAALDRLEQAMGKLESTLAHAPEKSAPPPGIDPPEMAELHKLREDHARLDDASRVVATRLDGIIERLKTVLGE